MAIFLTADSKVIVQGITGSEGTKHTRRMVSSGTKVVGGVNPRKAGSDVDGIPVFATVAEAMERTGADVSVIFVPPAFAADSQWIAYAIGYSEEQEERMRTQRRPIHRKLGLLKLDGASDPLTHLGRDAALAVDDPRHGLEADARESRDVLHRRPRDRP